jgi:enoyl-[acyl-carrier protein] reductase I
VHSIAFAPGEAIEGDFLDGISRDAFRIAHDVSSYSFPALAKAARPLLLKGSNPALLLRCPISVPSAPCPTTTPWAWPRPAWKRQRATSPSASARRASAPTPSRPARSRRSPPPASATSASCSPTTPNAPLRRNVTIEEVGNVAAFLLSDLASGITGEITYVDGGLNTTALGNRGSTAAIEPCSQTTKQTDWCRVSPFCRLSATSLRINGAA